MPKKQYKIYLMKPYLKNYLNKYHGIDTTKSFKCFNKKCDSNNMTYSNIYNNCYCPVCKKKYDIFEIVAIDYDINPKCFVKQIKKVLELYPDIDSSH